MEGGGGEVGVKNWQNYTDVIYGAPLTQQEREGGVIMNYVHTASDDDGHWEGVHGLINL